MDTLKSALSKKKKKRKKKEEEKIDLIPTVFLKS